MGLRDYMSEAGIRNSDLILLERYFALRDVVEHRHDKLLKTVDA